MSYLDLFQRCGSPSREAEIRLSNYLLRPDTLTADRVKTYDESAALMTAACRDQLELIRDPGYRGKPVLYFVRIVRTYEDGTTERVLDEKYFGAERRKAFVRFAELKRQRPGIETMQDTDRRHWEK